MEHRIYEAISERFVREQEEVVTCVTVDPVESLSDDRCQDGLQCD